MNKNIICDYILKYADQNDCPPTDVVKPHLNYIGIAWNTRQYYCDIEINDTSVEATLSRDREHLRVVTFDMITHPATDIELNKVLEEIFTIIKRY